MTSRYSKNKYEQLDDKALKSIGRAMAGTDYYCRQDIDVKVNNCTVYLSIECLNLRVCSPIHLEDPLVTSFFRKIPAEISRSSYPPSTVVPSFNKDPQLFEWRLYTGIPDEAVEVLSMLLLKYGMLLFKKKGAWHIADENLTFIQKVEYDVWYSLCGPYTYEEHLEIIKGKYTHTWYKGKIKHLAGSFDSLLEHGKYRGSTLL